MHLSVQDGTEALKHHEWPKWSIDRLWTSQKQPEASITNQTRALASTLGFKPVRPLVPMDDCLAKILNKSLNLSIIEFKSWNMEIDRVNYWFQGMQKSVSSQSGSNRSDLILMVISATFNHINFLLSELQMSVNHIQLGLVNFHFRYRFLICMSWMSYI